MTTEKFADIFSNLSDVVAFSYVANRGWALEVGAIENVDDHFYFVPHPKNMDLWAKSGVTIKSANNVNIAMDVAAQIGHKKKIFGDIAINHPRGGVGFGGNIDFDTNECYAYVSSYYNAKTHKMTYIASAVYVNGWWFVNAGIDRSNVQAFISLLTHNLGLKPMVSAGISWRIAGERHTR